VSRLVTYESTSVFFVAKNGRTSLDVPVFANMDVVKALSCLEVVHSCFFIRFIHSFILFVLPACIPSHTKNEI
jgi:hypothetical protein